MNPPRILIVKLSALGDIIHTLPVLPAIKKRFPEGELFWLIEERFSPILWKNPYLTEIITVDTKKNRRKPLSAAKELIALKKKCSSLNLDIAIDFQGLIKSSLLSLISGARLRLGYGKRDLREPFSRFFYHKKRDPLRSERHIVDKHLGLLSLIGVKKPEEVSFPICLSPEEEQTGEEFRKRAGGEFIIVNPAGGWENKCYPPDMFSRAGDIIKRKTKLPLFISHGPEERPLALRVKKGMKEKGELLPETRIRELAAIIKQAALIISADTAPLHLASAFSIPTVGIYGPTDPLRNGPYWKGVTLYKKIDCSPCYKRRCHLSPPPCISAISPEEVAEKALSLLR
jgi:lipopolysaccharide heptosyltransferase I